MKKTVLLWFVFVVWCVNGVVSGGTKKPEYPCYDMRDDLTPSHLTIAMWDFSWLNGHYPGGWAEDFDRVTDELIERKFNTVRIDAFPMVIHSLHQQGKTNYFVKANPYATWGHSTVDHEHDIVGELKEFMTITKRKKLYVILSSWGMGRSEKYTDRRQFWNAWETTLDILEKDGLLSHVLYVDFDQEFPYFSPFQARLNQLAEVKVDASLNQADAMEQAGSGTGVWNAAQTEFVKDYFESTLAHFHQKYPDLRFTFSLTSFWNEVRAMKLKGMDVLELHIWISGAFYQQIGFDKVKKDRDPDNDYKEYMARIREAINDKEPLQAHMKQQLETAQAWSCELNVPLTTTEAWGPWWHMDHPDLEWDWLYDWCEMCMGLAGDYGFWGTTPWNYSHPYWDNWKNIAWYKRLNQAFLEHE